MKNSISLADFPAEPRVLADRILMVTGTGSGIGYGIAIAAASAGATVILLDKNQRALDKVYDEIVANKGSEPVQICVDLTKARAEEWDLLAQQIDAAFGRLDGLIHCAAQSTPLTPLQHANPEDWQKALQCNVTAPWMLTRTLLPLLNQSTSAAVVFSSGEAARTGKAYWNITGITWGAVDAMASIWHEELESNNAISVYSLDPGAVNTPMRTRLCPAEDPAMTSSVEVVAKAYLYLVSNVNSDLSGNRLTLNGESLTIV